MLLVKPPWQSYTLKRTSMHTFETRHLQRQLDITEHQKKNLEREIEHLQQRTNNTAATNARSTHSYSVYSKQHFTDYPSASANFASLVPGLNDRTAQLPRQLSKHSVGAGGGHGGGDDTGACSLAPISAPTDS